MINWIVRHAASCSGRSSRNRPCSRNCRELGETSGYQGTYEVSHQVLSCSIIS